MLKQMLKPMLKPFARAFTTVLTVTPFPSVPRDHVWSMLIRAMVVDDFGIAPYWFPQITSRTAGLMTSSTTNSFSTLETQDISEISLKSFFRSNMGFFLGRGGTLARWWATAAHGMMHWGFMWWERPGCPNTPSKANLERYLARTPCIDWDLPRPSGQVLCWLLKIWVCPPGESG